MIEIGRRKFLGWLGLGAVAAPALPSLIERLAASTSMTVIGIDPAVGSGAVASLRLSGGVITCIDIISAGSDYLTPPTITFSDRLR